MTTAPPPTPAQLDADLRAAAAAAVAEAANRVAQDPWRQRYHIQPPVGLLNDPNGLVQHDDVIHLCYQWNPLAPAHGAKFWAHCTSTDLVHWQWQPIALTPSDDYDRQGCYSGSGVVHDGQVHFVYTGNKRFPDGGRDATTCLAVLTDAGVHKHLANPVAGRPPGVTDHVRDPKVWAEDGAWWMVLGAQRADHTGTVLLARSHDLVQWEHLGPLRGLESLPLGYMCECPDLVSVGTGDNRRHVLIVSPQLDHGEHAAGPRWQDLSVASVGRLDLSTATFHAGEPRPLDAGFDYYAPQTMMLRDGRCVLVAWMGMPDHPGEPVLGEKHPTVANGWVHCLTVPRQITVVDGTVRQQPVAELERLHESTVTHRDVELAADAPARALPQVSGTAFDLVVVARCAAGAALDLGLRAGGAHQTLLRVDPRKATLTLDRSRSGAGAGGTRQAMIRRQETVTLRVLADASSLEVFLDDGETTATARIYPPPDATGITFRAVGGAVHLERVDCSTMASAGA